MDTDTNEQGGIMQAIVRELQDTGREAILHGRVEKIYETWTQGGPFDGATYEVAESEMRPTDIIVDQTQS